MRTWADVERFLLAQAELDLRTTGEVRPCLVAYEQDTQLLVAFVRPFSSGRYVAPLVELLALVGALGADRLALSMSGRVWSLSDPVPPVLEGVGDLRQRVVIVQRTDGHRLPVSTESTLAPFDLTNGQLRWKEKTPLGKPNGWISWALEVAVRERYRLRAPAVEIAAQVRRCAARGHDLALSDAVSGA